MDMRQEMQTKFANRTWWLHSRGYIIDGGIML